VYLGSNFSKIFLGLHVPLESMLEDKDIQATIKELVTSSGRSYPGKKVDAAGGSGQKPTNGKA
jgi:4-alpha-glucanotransferase